MVEHTNGYTGDVAKAANVTTNDPKYANFSLMLRAHFTLDTTAVAGAPPATPKRTPVFIEPTDRWITSVLVGNTTSTKLSLVNNDPTPIHIKSIEPGGVNFTADFKPVQDGRRYDLTVQTVPHLKPGTYHQTLKVVTDNAAVPPVPIDLTVTVYPRIFASPPAIIMPQLPINTELEAISWPSVIVRKVQANGLELKRVSSSLAFLILTTETQKEGEVYQIKIKIDSRKVQAGQFKGTIRIETNDADMPLIEVPVQVGFQ